MTVLVTGARGGLGRLLLPLLRASEREDIVAVSREGADGTVACDLASREAIAALVAQTKPRLIYHLAGSFAHRYEVDHPVNALAAHHLLEEVKRHGLAARVVLMGSAAEYGVVEPSENPVPETRVLRPVSVYGVTKAHQTHIAGWHAISHGADVVVARLFNLLAAGLSERLFVGRVEQLARRWKAKEIEAMELGNLDAQRDYIEGDEAVRQLRVVASRGQAGGIYHVASGEPTRLRDLLPRLLDAWGVPREAVRENVSGAGGRSGYDVPVIYADMQRTRALGDNRA
jgi:GDP-4-dehydro-6-deoxy-D-mannose reductase